MNAPPRPEVLQVSIASEGVTSLRYVWKGRYGTIVVEIVDGIAYVNGQAVESMTDLQQPGIVAPSID